MPTAATAAQNYKWTDSKQQRFMTNAMGRLRAPLCLWGLAGGRSFLPTCARTGQWMRPTVGRGQVRRGLLGAFCGYLKVHVVVYEIK